MVGLNPPFRALMGHSVRGGVLTLVLYLVPEVRVAELLRKGTFPDTVAHPRLLNLVRLLVVSWCRGQ